MLERTSASIRSVHIYFRYFFWIPDILLFSYFIFPFVISRKLSCIFFKQMRKIGWITDSDLLADITDAGSSVFQQSLCQLHSTLQQILFECHMKGILEYPSKIYRIQIYMCRH